MCGIAGIIDLEGQRPIDPAVIRRMTDVQSHRGPDDSGFHVEPGVALGHRRLSIIDLSGGHQPMFNEDGSVVVVYNGEIYNFADLRAELISAGHEFRTNSDTEVVVHGWEQWGERCVDRFRGMFAFGLWDRRRGRAFLARDRVGIKPLHYAILPDGYLLFASELKGLVAWPDFPREIEPRAVEDFFAFGYVPDPRTIYRHALKLAPGHRMSLVRGQARHVPTQYWDLHFLNEGATDERQASVDLIERLRDAVRVRLISEVPLGAFLSGGVDSSAVVAMMAGLSERPVTTCSISFGDPQFNEASFAESVAARYRTDHHTDEVVPGDFDLVDRLVDIYDEPYADSSALPTYRVCELARRRVTVALSGDGGDESFAGYRRYRWHCYEERFRSFAPSAVRRVLFGAAGRLYPKLAWAPRIFRAKSTLLSLAQGGLEGYMDSVAIIPTSMREKMFSAEFRSSLQGHRAIDVLEAHASRSGADDPLSLVQYLDFKTYLPGDILTKVDRASMAHSLEVRVPILDHQFLEWACTLHPSLRLRGREGKFILKKSLESFLPDEILYRPKMGFAVPLARWFRGPLRDRLRDAVLGSTLADSGIFDTDYLRTVVAQHEAGTRDHSAALWALMSFGGFLRALESPAPDDASDRHL